MYAVYPTAHCGEDDGYHDSHAAGDADDVEQGRDGNVFHELQILNLGSSRTP